MPDTPAQRAPRLPQTLGRLGLYSTYVAAALFLIVIAGDLAVLVRHALLQGWLALLVGVGPLVALLLSTLASYSNYYGVWRIVRGKDEYDAKEDLKSHAADAPQAAQALLAGRAGCLPRASTALLFLSLLLVLTTILPPQAPLVGALGDWNVRVGGLTLVSGATTPTATPALTSAAAPTATSGILLTPTQTAAPRPTATSKPGAAKPAATPKPGATATPRPTATPAPTPTATPVIAFSISPTSAPDYFCGGAPPPKTITLDTSGSMAPVSWSASISPTGAGTVSPSSGVTPANSRQNITVSPVCPSANSQVTVVVTIKASGDANTSTFTWTIHGQFG